MNSKKKEEKRKKRGFLSFQEHLEKREDNFQKQYEKNPKNKGKKRFSS
jgi:hypothetical protein